MKKQNTLQSLQNCWAKWLPIPPRRIWKCVSLRKTVHVPARRALAAKAKQLNLDAIHDTVHEMAKDEARHGCAFAGFLKRYFND